MLPTIARVDEQLLGLENASATFKARAAMGQSRKGHLPVALDRERAALISASARLWSGNNRLRALVHASDQTA